MKIFAWCIVLAGCASAPFSPPRYADPGPVLFDLVGADNTLDRAALCGLESTCARAGAACTRYPPTRSLAAHEEASVRACAFLARSCEDVTRCLQLGGPPTDLSDLNLTTPKAICQAQARCLGTPVSRCMTFLEANPPRPAEVATIAACTSKSTDCVEVMSCLHLERNGRQQKEDAAYRSEAYEAHIRRRERAAMERELSDYPHMESGLRRAIDAACECRDLACIRRVMTRFERTLQGAGAPTRRQLEAFERLMAPELERLNRCLSDVQH